MTDSETEFWFNTKTNQVEVGKQSIAVYRIGPFKSRQEAQNALVHLAKKSAAWREEEEKDD
ncbi:MAG: SPOR domain-containing protein [Micrococcales bacterium]